MRKTRRTAQVGETIRDALVQVFRTEMKNIDLGLVSIADVQVSPDLHFARVFISSLHEKEGQEAVRHLQNARGRIRRSLGQAIRLRYTPELEFKYDETPMRANRIETILRDLNPAASPATEIHDDDTRNNDDDES